MVGRKRSPGRSPQSQVEDEPLQEETWKVVLRKKAALTKGGRIELLTGLAYEAALRALLKQDPTLFQDLLAIAAGQSEGVSAESMAYLKDNRLLRPDGTIDPDFRRVLFSSYVPDAPAGPCIVSPFRLTHREARELERAQDQANLNLLRLLREEEHG